MLRTNGLILALRIMGIWKRGWWTTSLISFLLTDFSLFSSSPTENNLAISTSLFLWLWIIQKSFLENLNFSNLLHTPFVTQSIIPPPPRKMFRESSETRCKWCSEICGHWSYFLFLQKQNSSIHFPSTLSHTHSWLMTDFWPNTFYQNSAPQDHHDFPYSLLQTLFQSPSLNVSSFLWSAINLYFFIEICFQLYVGPRPLEVICPRSPSGSKLQRCNLNTDRPVARSLALNNIFELFFKDGVSCPTTWILITLSSEAGVSKPWPMSQFSSLPIFITEVSLAASLAPSCTHCLWQFSHYKDRAESLC